MLSIAELTVLSLEELEEECVWIDRRDSQDDVIKYLSDCVLEEDECKAIWKDEELWLRYRDEEYRIPIEKSDKDPYILIHSIAAIWDGLYEIRVLHSTLEGETHAFLPLSVSKWKKIDQEHAIWCKDYFEKLRPGWDYFQKAQVPFLQFE